MYGILSVQHTGTRFLVHELNCPRAVEHTYPNNAKRVAKLIASRPTIVVPLRHPARVYESWVRRERRIHELAEQYAVMMSLSQKFDFKYVDVEAAGKDPIGSNVGTAGIEITHGMITRVPPDILDWYAEKLQDAVTLDELRG